ncbi:MAG TPA: AbrB/MazE/SpoVT family DNA-binding domain-containing protein [Thiotrichales bacterium]|nr:AbrB/MazE/SpoVT family DNA-binding domain-containing protein [Thiotrichales bacterium]
MKVKIVRIGNSRGFRLPKPLIELAGLGDEVELEVRDGEIVISRVGRPRQDWAEAAESLGCLGEDELLDPPVSTRFDREDWEW